ncbi:hypothetical protein JQ633_34365 [Bradyrhizobium tropiciagri]|uniref:hypothetical protein n=1 Tax=Bradyrhizobium tropiciagri TaxID=312253 RepID=UPI001BA6B24D|nr:hypothetical protein [Bradyrhizobium tropiciagri]MBR0875481.1 hypothetical protein [Bradyrhizobium tropiciagri]
MNAKRSAEWTAVFDLRAGYFALLALMTLPVLFPIPRTADLVNHWARLTVLAMPASDPLNTFYRVEWGVIPNLGIDLIYMALAPALSVETIVRLTFTLSFWLPAVGVWFLHGTWAQKPSPTILIAPVLSYNLVTTVGLVNYGIGIGVALIALAWWAANERRRIVRDLLILNAAAVAMFFCHLLALAGFCVIFGLLEATPHRGELFRTTFVRALLSPLYVAVALVLIWFMPPMQSGYQLEGQKSWMLVAPFFSGLSYDIPWGAGMAAMILALFATRLVVVAKPARYAVFGFVILAVFAPSSIGTANFVDARLVELWVCLALSATVVRVPEPRHLTAVISAAAVAFACIRLAVIIPAWRSYNEDVAEMRTAFSAVPLGSSVLAVTPPNCRDPDIDFEYNLSTFVVIDRRAQVNTLFAGQGLQPLRARDPAIAAAPQTIAKSEWLMETAQSKADLLALGAGVIAHWRDHFNVVVDIHGTCQSAVTAPGLERVASSRIADVYIASRPR